MAVIMFCDALYVCIFFQNANEICYLVCALSDDGCYGVSPCRSISNFMIWGHRACASFHGLLQIPIICLFVIWKGLGTLILGWPNSGCSFFLLLTSNSGLQIQLIRIELRVPEYGWTTQKVFHLLNFIVNGGELQWPLFCRHSSLLHAWSKIGFPLIFLYCLLGAVQAAGFSQQNRFCPNGFYIACFGVV
jgi:hypothetical protein